MIMDLILEIRDQANDTLVIAGAAFAPGVGEDYWSHRVRLSETQAVIGFPKFSTVGIGFAVEEDSWNTNLPYSCPTGKIFDHIIDNKGDEEISNTDVREAILMIQLAVIDERATARREFFNGVHHSVSHTATSVEYATYDALMTELERAMREHEMLRAEVDHLRSAATPAADGAFPGASPIPDGSHGFMSLLLRLGVLTKDGRMLATDGKYEMREGTDAPIRSLIDESAPHVSDVVARIVGLWRVDNDVYAVGVAGPELAEDLNLGRLVLGAELDADVVVGGPQGDPPCIVIRSGRVCGAMVRRPEGFAWAS
jgi:hypothetical protein